MTGQARRRFDPAHTTVTIKPDDYGAEVRVYIDSIREDCYWMANEDGDPRATIPAGVRIVEVGR